MKKIKIQERLDKAVDAFFENEINAENSQLVIRENSYLLCDFGEEETEENKAGMAVQIAKLIFLFIPGSFFLFRFSLTFGYFAFFQSNTITPGYDVDYHYVPVLLKELATLTFFLGSGCFLTYIGIGRLRELRNLLVPALIVTLSLGLTALSSVFPEPLRGRMVMYYSIYLFPVLLIAAGLLKYWIAEKPAKE